MAFYKKDIVFIQRDDANSLYQQVNISASNAIIYVDTDGHIAASKISSFPYTWPSSSHAITSSYAITASHALNVTAQTSDSASWASSSVWAYSASRASSSISSSYAETSSFAFTASHAFTGISSSYASTCSVYEYYYYNVTESFSFTAESASRASSSLSSSYSETSSYAFTASYALNVTAQTSDSASWASSSLTSYSSSFASSSISASHALISNTSSYVLALNVHGTVISSSYAITSSVALNSSISTSSSFASSSISSSVSLTASYIGSGVNNYFPRWSSNTLTPTSAIYEDVTYVGIGTNNTVVSPIGKLVINESAVRHLVLRNEAAGGIPWSLVSTDDNNLSSGSRLVILAGNDQSDTPALLIWSSSSDLKRVGINKTHPSVELDVSGSMSASYYYSKFDDIGFVGTSSWAVSASWAPQPEISSTSSFSISSSISVTSSYSISSSYSITSSYSISSSWAETASYVSGNFWQQGGNAWGELGFLGTTDEEELSLIINGSELVRFTTGSGVGILTRPTDFTLQIAGAVGPSLDNTYDLGSPSLRWKNVYAANLVASGSITNATFAETASIALSSISSISASVVGVGTAANDSPYNVTFVTASTGNTSLNVDDGQVFVYNPVRNLLVVSNISSSLEGTASWARNAITSSISITSSFAHTASFALNAGGGSTFVSGSTYSITSSHAIMSDTASYFYGPTGSQAWHIYVEPTSGDLVFDFV